MRIRSQLGRRRAALAAVATVVVVTGLQAPAQADLLPSVPSVPVLQPVLDPVLDPVETVVCPVLDPLVCPVDDPVGTAGTVLDPVLGTVGTVANPVLGTIGTVVDPVLGPVLDPVLGSLPTSPLPVQPVPVPGPVGDVLGGVTQVIEGIVGEIVPTGWLYDDSVTTLAQVRSTIGAHSLWRKGHTGRGVGVALIDTGVVPVKGLDSGNVVNGADLSFESQAPDLRYYDTFGHGTHMAGIIAGDDPKGRLLDLDRFHGVAPGAQLTSLKVAASDGGVDVSQVVAAVDWVVEHRNDDPKNPIRVLNLSYGTDGVQDYRVDPLTHAVENAWRAGIVVVVVRRQPGTRQRHAGQPRVRPARPHRRRRRHPGHRDPERRRRPRLLQPR